VHAELNLSKSNPQKEAYITNARLLNQQEKVSQRFKTYEDILIEIKWTNQSAVAVNPNFMLLNTNNQTVMVALDTPIDWSGQKKAKAGTYISRFVIPKNLLNAGDYVLNLALDSSIRSTCFDVQLSALMFSVWDPMDNQSLARGNFSIVREDAVLMPALECSFEYLGELGND